jgi:hypothetical protein
MPILRIKDKIYRNNIIFIYDEDDKKILRYLKSKTEHNIEELLKTAVAFVVPSEDKNYWLVIKKDAEDFENSLVHECLHITAKVMSSCLINLIEATEEAYAYYMEWLFNECLTRRNKLIARTEQVGTTSNGVVS